MGDTIALIALIRRDVLIVAVLVRFGAVQTSPSVYAPSAMAQASAHAVNILNPRTPTALNVELTNDIDQTHNIAHT